MERKPHSVSPQAHPLTVLVIRVYLGTESHLSLALTKTELVKDIYEKLYPREGLLSYMIVLAVCLFGSAYRWMWDDVID